jgi:hypothetical protein
MLDAGMRELGINKLEPRKVISLNRLWDGKDPLAAVKLQGTAANGQVSEKVVNKFPLLTSRDIVDGKVVKQPDGSSGLSLTLNQVAFSRWRLSEQECKYDSWLVFVVDGQIFGHVNVPVFDEASKSVLITGKWANQKELADIVAAISWNQKAFDF